MPIAFEPSTRTFQIDTKYTSMIFRVYDGGYLLGQYWGARIKPTDLTRLWQTCPSGFTPFYPGAQENPYSLDLFPSEYPVYGSGDFRSPAIDVEFANGSRLLDLRYHNHTIIEGDQISLKGLPQMRGADQTLEITLRDAPTGLEVVLRYAVYAECDSITRSVRIINHTGQPVRILRALSASIDIPNESYEMINLYGSYARERYPDRQSLRHGGQRVESRRGASGHQQNPFVALVSPETTEHAGNAYGAALIYSGNFLANVELDPFEFVRLQLGINPFHFVWNLEDGDEFCTPEAVLSYSKKGLNQLSQSFHNVFKNHLCKSKYRNRPRPIVLNSWEATYFKYDEQKICNLIDSCKGLGIDIFVLDDGWFGNRDDDTSSLGDWFVDPKKLPRGLDPLIERCEQNGMRFGLWFEPEMISENSVLYTAHPDWCIRQEGRECCLGRQQMILDLSRKDVLEYLKNAVGTILSEHRISYVKWDMNRNLTDAYSAALLPEQQSEICHRYMLNLYELMDDLTTRFPDVLFEGCSGGGGRFDAGMLYYMPQIWTSDNTDAIERLKIQYGTSLAYPPLFMTAHVSACPNHQVGRITPFHTRGLVAMSASYGYELNPLSLTLEDREQIRQQTSMYKEIADLIAEGDFYRLISPFATNRCAWMFVSKNRKRAFAVHVQQLCQSTAPYYRLKLAGLNADAHYFIKELDRQFNGDELMEAGLSIPMAGDFTALSYTITQIE